MRPLAVVDLDDLIEAVGRIESCHQLITMPQHRALIDRALVQDLWSRVGAGHAPTLADRAALWTAAAHAAQHALEAIQLLYGVAGAEAVYARCPLDRCLRDARTALQHVTLQQHNYEHAGRLLLRAEPAPVWMIDYRGEDAARG